MFETHRHDSLDLHQRAEMQRATWHNRSGRSVRAEESGVSPIDFAPMRDVGHIDRASDDVVERGTHDARDRFDIVKREADLIADRSAFGVLRLFGHSELTRNIKGVAV